MSFFIPDEPALTDEIIVGIFEYLCACEIRKLLKILPNNQEGQQDGYVMCLTDLFGSVDEDIAESMYQRGKTYIHVIDRIMDTMKNHVNKWKNEPMSVDSFTRIKEVSDNAVREYFVHNSKEMIEAIKFL